MRLDAKSKWVWRIACGSAIAVTGQAAGWTLFAPGALGWERALLSVRVSSPTCGSSSERVMQAARDAADFWSTPGRMVIKTAFVGEGESASRFRRGLSQNVPLITCDPNFLSSEGEGKPAVTRGALDPSGRISYAGILLNLDQDSSSHIGLLSRAQLETVMRHEFGHLLGLGHSPVREACMYPETGIEGCRELHGEDGEAFRHLYPQREDLQDWSLGLAVGLLAVLAARFYCRFS